MTPDWEVVCGDALETLRQLRPKSVHCCVTSPPYWGLRTYKTAAQIGLERTVDEYVERMVAVFREVRRVLRDDGSLWLNLGDTYTSGNRRSRDATVYDKHPSNGEFEQGMRPPTPEGLKAKDLVGLPWRVAFALQKDGWYLRNDVPWMKLNCTPSSVRDKLTVAHEYLFLLTKAKHYYHDIDAAKKPSLTGNKGKKTVRHLARTDAEVVRERGPIDECVDRQRRTSDAWRESLDRMIAHLQEVRDGGAVVDDDGLVAVLSATNSYKVAHFACVDDQTEALTPGGWRRHSELVDGDQIAAFDELTGTMGWEPATFHRYSFDGEMVVLEKRDVSAWMTPNHRCLIRQRRGKAARFVTSVVEACDLVARMEVPVSAPWKTEREWSVGTRWAALLGWYIAEGHNKSKNRICIYQSLSANAAKCRTIRSILVALGAKFTEKTRYRTWRGRPSTEMVWIVRGRVAQRLKELAPQKAMTPQLATLCEADAAALLGALVDGDGHRRPDGRNCITQKDKNSIDLMQVLAIRLGYRAMVRPRKDGMHVLYLTRGRWLTLRSTNGKSSPPLRRRYCGTVWCPSIPSTFWLARRDGKTIITGNTFPPALVEPCVLSSTSERGVCAACGAPWARVVERTAMVVEPSARRAEAEAHGAGSGRTVMAGTMTQAPTTTTVGWQATCECAAEVVPAIVLDCFNGAGTTGLVATRLGRRYLGIDLNSDYCEMARKRITAG